MRHASCRQRPAHAADVRLVSASFDGWPRSRRPADADSQACHERRQAAIWRCSGRSSELRRRRRQIRSGRNPLSGAGNRDGEPDSRLTRADRKERRISGPVARAAWWYGTAVSSARSTRRGLRAMAYANSSRTSTRDRRNSSRAIGGARPPTPRATLLRKPLSAKSANVSSRISRIMPSKSSRVSLRRSGSVITSKRFAPVPGSRNSASTVPA